MVGHSRTQGKRAAQTTSVVDQAAKR